MADVRSVSEWMAAHGLTENELLDTAGLEKKVLRAIIQGRYTPSPQQRQRVAAALGVAPDEVAWGHVTPVEHVYGHGPQFGRSP